jgi:peptide/nickel transport system ATP-binding protein
VSVIAAQTHVLSVEDLTVQYATPHGPIKAVDGVSFVLRPGERLGLIGESGSGKTTLGTALMRLTRPPGRIVGGRVMVNGHDLLALSERALNRIRLREIALVPQGAMNALNPVMRIGDQIVDGIIAHEGEVPRREMADRVARAMARVGLPGPLADRFPHELSGGQKQRVAIAIATVLNPAVIVADEPTSALDVVVQRQVMLTLGRVQEGLGAAVILIGHDMGLIAQFAETIGVLYAGKLVEYGPIDEVLESPRHPYTRLLVDSLPRLDAKHELRGIPGLPPVLLNLPPGCPFAARCPYAFDRCVGETPLLQEVGVMHRVACHLYPDHTALPALPPSVGVVAV